MGRGKHDILPDLLLVHEVEEAEGCDGVLGELDQKCACATTTCKGSGQNQITVG